MSSIELRHPLLIVRLSSWISYLVDVVDSGPEPDIDESDYQTHIRATHGPQASCQGMF